MQKILLEFINYLRHRNELKYTQQTKEKDYPVVIIINNNGK